MCKLNYSLTGFACLSIFIVAAILNMPSVSYGQKATTASPSAAPSPPTSNVKVVNTTNEPIPVSVAGTPSVNVGNIPTVNIDPTHNTVKVDNDVSLVTRDEGIPFSLRATLPSGFVLGAFQFYNVPLGKRLIIEYASIRVTGATDAEHIRASIETGGGPNGTVFQKYYIPRTALGTDDYVFATPIRVTFGQMETASVGAERDATNAAMQVEIQISGRLVDMEFVGRAPASKSPPGR